MKPNFTQQQKNAIYAKDNNILVSAGAGSGKTAILTERVLQKLIEGFNITQLVIITFTKAAAGEMMERIRHKIEKEIENHPHLEIQLELLDSAYITTFDAFSMSLVKKYHYELDLNPSINIGDKIIFKNELRKIIDLMFEEYIENENEEFINLLKEFTITDSNLLKDNIIKIFYQYQSFVSPINEIDEIFNLDYLEEQKKIYLDNIKSIKSDIKEIINELQCVQTDDDGLEYISSLTSSLMPIITSNSFEETFFLLDEPMIQKSRKKFESKHIINEYYDEIKILVNKLNNLIDVESMDVHQDRYLSTKKNANSILLFIKELEFRFYEFKKSINSFDFTDIVKMCLNIIENNPEIQKEIKDSIKEIMIDEYQDTDDFQNKLVELISDKNVYMVGDIKQSIYGFRNANPKNFANKYIEFKNNIGGIAVDLNKNFRSNQLVLENINNIFAPIMSKDIGGVEYDESQSLVYGNMDYSISTNKEQFNIFRYNLEYIKELKDSKIFITKHEYEAIIIAKDIKDKINSKYQVTDFKNNKMRDCILSDFSILTRNKKHIKTYNKILRSYGLIVDAQEDVAYKVEKDIILIKNLLIAITFDNVNDYKNSLISILRSFLYEFDDNKIDDIFRD
ncbi:MAG: UvrD-helicase domain-containing protein, partial [Mycoplasmatales bacterium]